MGGPELPKFSGDREDFEEYHDEMSNYAVSKHFDDVWSAKAHRYFPDDTIDVQLRSRKQKKVIKKNNKAISCLRGSFMNSSELLTFISQSVDAIPEREDPTTYQVKFPHGRIHMVLEKLYKKYRGRSFLDRLRLDKDKENIVMSENEHPDMLFARAAVVERKYMYRGVKPTYDELVGRIVFGATPYYRGFMISTLTTLEKRHGQDVFDKNKVDVLEELQRLTTRLYVSRNIVDSDFEEEQEEDQYE